MEKTAYVENFLDYIQAIYYSDKEFSAKNGYVNVKRRTNDEIIKEVC